MQTDPKLILLTGATGYVGGRLLHALEAAGHHVRCLSRHPEALRQRVARTTEVVKGDVLDADSLAPGMVGVHTAYYLVHSMASANSFEVEDRRAAQAFAVAARDAGVQRIIYLSGLGSGSELSAHLRSRQEVGRILRESGVPTIEFRAAIVIGSGSASFEMIRALVEKLPVMITPRWVNTSTQPIAVEDVIAYLRLALGVEFNASRIIEIGGADRVTIRPLGSREALKRALANEDREFAETRWSDAFSSVRGSPQWGGTTFGRRIVDSRTVRVSFSPRMAFRPIEQLGGKTGWYYGDWLWRARGLLDLLFGGAGLRRGRRVPDRLLAGDTLDFWRVEAIQTDSLLRLAAEMRLPGRAWLQFEVKPDGAGSVVRQTAIFDPAGVLGQLYWYLLYPVHQFVFAGMLRGIVVPMGESL